MTTEHRLQLEDSWKTALYDEFSQPYISRIREFLQAEKAAGKTIYPAGRFIFNALNSTPLPQVKVVILGQDPYHGPNQAHGLSFSVLPSVPTPPSLQNIYKELQRDLGLPIPSHGYLQSWAEQGVLLLNTSLTVEQGQAASHAKIGWQTLTDRIIQTVNEHAEHVVFLLWGNHAQSKAGLIDPTKHLVLKSVHPSPLSAHRGFFGNGHFSRANQFLRSHGMTPIDWALPATVEVP